MEQLPFSYNWNQKLDCNAFTSMRLMSQKYQVGTKFEIIIKGRQPFIATLIAVKTFQLKQLTPFMSYIDTGYSVQECIKLVETMYKNAKNVNVHTATWAFL